ncbi:hypothetical protein BDFB_011319 [Asbolus verrucosus]|uniref:DDE 3 domain containing protein n=1 Tax=Asbolus verrucosus TaxID=1661398 RepID=A0A482V1P3_ASBVE|nr:hypothetical protein BDFB_011319 [Asbolus verrucosus]
MIWGGVMNDIRTEPVIFRNGSVNSTCMKCYKSICKNMHKILSFSKITLEDILHIFPNINPTEQVWSEMLRQLRRRLHSPHTFDELQKALIEEWRSVSQNTILNLINSMPRRCHAEYML